MIKFLLILLLLTSTFSWADQAKRDVILKDIENINTVDEVKVMKQKIIDNIIKELELDFENELTMLNNIINREKWVTRTNRKDRDNVTNIKLYQSMIDKYKYSNNYELQLMIDRDQLCYTHIPIENVINEENLLSKIEGEDTLKILKFHNDIVDSLFKSDYKDRNIKIREHLEFVLDTNLSYTKYNVSYSDIVDEYAKAASNLISLSNDNEIKKMGLDFAVCRYISEQYPDKAKLIHWNQSPAYNSFLKSLSRWLDNAIKENETNKELVDHFTFVYRYLEDEKFKHGLIDEKKMPMTVQNRIKMLVEKKINKEADAIYNKSVINFAIISGDIELVKMLLDKGISIDVKDIDGKLPIDYANENVKNKVPGSEKILALLTLYMKKN
ncbi:MAG: ankyrin repeat domain-containing protein [bacterium]